MKAYPLIKVKWSNEFIMAVLFAVLILYHLPMWGDDPIRIVNFILMVIAGLLIDFIGCQLRHRRIWCCVSGAVTAGIISLLTGNVPLWGQLLGVAFGLIAGKHLQGGTGKNITNPAVAALVILLPYFGFPRFFFEPSWLLLPGLILGLVFLVSRPYAGIAFMLGMLGAMYINQELSLTNILAYGVLFWGCIVLTDPVTVTPHPLVGSVMGLLAGILPIFLFKTPVAAVLGVLFVNLFSEDVAGIFYKIAKKRKAVLHIPKVFLKAGSQPEMIDLTGNKEYSPMNSQDMKQLTKEIILHRINSNEVFGMGGAAFSTYQKLITVLNAEETDKYLIINAAECDPGLIHDEWLLRNHFEEVRKGVELLRTCIDFKAMYLAIKDRNGVSDTDQLNIREVKDRYPIGAEKILIDELLGKSLTNDQLPAKLGVLVLNVQTVYAVSQAVLGNQPINSRYLTVANLRDKTVKVVKVKLGMKLTDILEAAYPGSVNLFAGGGIMQAYLADEDDVVDRRINFIATGNMPDYKESPQCSKCGTCAKICPTGLPVKRIADLVDQGLLDKTRKYRAKDCISCGSCSYSCLAGNNLAIKVRLAKEAIIKEDL